MRYREHLNQNIRDKKQNGDSTWHSGKGVTWDTHSPCRSARIQISAYSSWQLPVHAHPGRLQLRLGYSGSHRPHRKLSLQPIPVTVIWKGNVWMENAPCPVLCLSTKYNNEIIIKVDSGCHLEEKVRETLPLNRFRASFRKDRKNVEMDGGGRCNTWLFLSPVNLDLR